MSSHLVLRGRPLSRRRFISGLAFATAASSTVVLAPTAARAEAREWQEYRDEGIGFRFELPGQFKFDLDTPLDSTLIVRGAHLEAEFDGMDVLVVAMELRDRDVLPVDSFYELLRAGAPATGNPPSREEQRTVSGVPAHDFIREADNINYIYRLVIVDNRVIILYVIGGRNIHGNPTVLRFLDSLALMRGPEPY